MSALQFPNFEPTLVYELIIFVNFFLTTVSPSTCRDPSRTDFAVADPLVSSFGSRFHVLDVSYL